MGSERQPLARLAVPVFNLIALVKTKTEELKILALTGLRDPISDGVWDYCSRLASCDLSTGCPFDLNGRC